MRSSRPTENFVCLVIWERSGLIFCSQQLLYPTRRAGSTADILGFHRTAEPGTWGLRWIWAIHFKQYLNHISNLQPLNSSLEQDEKGWGIMTASPGFIESDECSEEGDCSMWISWIWERLFERDQFESSIAQHWRDGKKKEIQSLAKHKKKEGSL